MNWAMHEFANVSGLIAICGLCYASLRALMPALRAARSVFREFVLAQHTRERVDTHDKLIRGIGERLARVEGKSEATRPFCNRGKPCSSGPKQQ